MGNRASVVFANDPFEHVYLHWNGGPESVYAFLDVFTAAGLWDHPQPARAFAVLVSRWMTPETPLQGSCSVYVEPRRRKLVDHCTEDGGAYLVTRNNEGCGYNVSERIVRQYPIGGEAFDKRLSTAEVMKEAFEAYAHYYRTGQEQKHGEHVYWNAGDKLDVAVADANRDVLPNLPAEIPAGHAVIRFDPELTKALVQ